MSPTYDRSRPAAASLVFGFHQIPEEGSQIRFHEKFTELYRVGEELGPQEAELRELFVHPITGEFFVYKVGSKLHVKGHYETELDANCDRCNQMVRIPVRESLENFLMPRDQFSKHDKPGGKVIHGPKRDNQKSRHHSRSKAEVLTDAEGEHEDLGFGEFDGSTVDLRPLLREELTLQVPMKVLCASDCKGLCLDCGANLNKEQCQVGCSTQLVEQVDFAPPREEHSALERELLKKYSKTPL